MVDLLEAEPSPEQRVASGAPQRLRQPLIPRWFKALLAAAFPFGFCYQVAGLWWALGVSAAIALLFAAVTTARDVAADRL